MTLSNTGEHTTSLTRRGAEWRARYRCSLTSVQMHCSVLQKKKEIQTSSAKTEFCEFFNRRVLLPFHREAVLFERKFRRGDAPKMNKNNGESQNSHSVSTSLHRPATRKNREILTENFEHASDDCKKFWNHYV